MQQKKYIILIGLFVILVLTAGCGRQTGTNPAQQPSQPLGQQIQPEGPQPVADSAPIVYPKITEDTPAATLEGECAKKTWPEYCTWIPEPNGRVLCEKCKGLAK